MNISPRMKSTENIDTVSAVWRLTVRHKNPRCRNLSELVSIMFPGWITVVFVTNSWSYRMTHTISFPTLFRIVLYHKSSLIVKLVIIFLNGNRLSDAAFTDKVPSLWHKLVFQFSKLTFKGLSDFTIWIIMVQLPVKKCWRLSKLSSQWLEIMPNSRMTITHQKKESTEFSNLWIR